MNGSIRWTPWQAFMDLPPSPFVFSFFQSFDQFIFSSFVWNRLFNFTIKCFNRSSAHLFSSLTAILSVNNFCIMFSHWSNIFDEFIDCRSHIESIFSRCRMYRQCTASHLFWRHFSTGLIIIVAIMLNNLFKFCMQMISNGIGILILIGIVNLWLLLPLALLSIAFYFLRRFYMATSRDVKLLEAESKTVWFNYIKTFELYFFKCSEESGVNAFIVFTCRFIDDTQSPNARDLSIGFWWSARRSNFCPLHVSCS